MIKSAFFLMEMEEGMEKGIKDKLLEKLRDYKNSSGRVLEIYGLDSGYQDRYDVLIKVEEINESGDEGFSNFRYFCKTIKEIKQIKEILPLYIIKRDK